MDSSNKGQEAVAAYMEGKTLREIGEALGVTHERARQILIAEGVTPRVRGPRGGLKYSPSFGKLTSREKFRACVKVNGHWLWLRKMYGGYGRFRMRGKVYYAHHAAFILTKGREPRGRMSRNCDVINCVNPDHWKERA